MSTITMTVEEIRAAFIPNKSGGFKYADGTLPVLSSNGQHILINGHWFQSLFTIHILEKRNDIPSVLVGRSSEQIAKDLANDKLRPFQIQLDMLIARATEQGVTLTIDTVPFKPLAMGNYAMIGNARLARDEDGEYK